jgi:dipeptidase E
LMGFNLVGSARAFVVFATSTPLLTDDEYFGESGVDRFRLLGRRIEGLICKRRRFAASGLQRTDSHAREPITFLIYADAMRLYLSSFGLGSKPKLFASLAGNNNRVALILSAGDAWGDKAHNVRVIEQTAMFSATGMEVTDVDLRTYTDRSAELECHLRTYGSVWVAGGNTFVLRRAMHDSGFDRIITKMLRDDVIAYGGYSAGICVLAADLRGLELVDDPTEVEQAFQKEVIWDGLGLLPYVPVPHFQSEHLESERIDRVVSFLKNEGVPHRTLGDGEVIVIDGQSAALIEAPR